jgi:3-methyladenine DNA glycosylase/8-oxoguanine DNA glycosylase
LTFFQGKPLFTTHLSIRTPSDFGFWSTVYSHGWCALPPFSVDRKRRSLRRLLELNDRTLVSCELRDGAARISVTVHSQRELGDGQREEVRQNLKSSLRSGEDLSEFYLVAQGLPRYRWIRAAGAGRLLRAPTVFEDIVKMICTTNCSWSLTEAMVGNLTRFLGRPFAPDQCSFPRADALAGVSESFLRRTIRAGYRSPYLAELAERVASGRLDVESWRTSPLPTEDLFREVRSVKGIGEYAAGNLLKLFGRYDYLGLDSWVRGKYFELHRRGRRVSDKTIERHYARLGRWRGLFFWLEMTREWYDRQFPF